MPTSDDPSALLPFAIIGIVIGTGLALGCGYGLYSQATGDGSPGEATEYARLEGPIERATWRKSAWPDGPDWYLQIHLEGDSRGFLVAASSLRGPVRAQLEDPTCQGASRTRIPALAGETATVVVDSSLWHSQQPYLSALHVQGHVVVPLDGRESGSSPLSPRIALWLVLITGALGGVGILGASVHHVFVSIRFKARFRE